MAVRVLSNEVSDLCLGKPALRPLSVSATVADALSLLRRSSGDPCLSVWSLPCECVGKISIVDVLCFLCREENVSRPSVALHSPVSLLLEGQKNSLSQLVKLLEPNSSLLEAVDCILEGAHSLIVPKRSRTSGSPRKSLQKPSLGSQFCWITQEDVIRFFLNSINHFSPMASQSIQSLNMIQTENLQVHYDHPALYALSAINSGHAGQTAVAVVDDEGRLVGEISVYTLACCDETIAPAVATLSAGDLLAYVDYGGPPEYLVQLVKQRLKERNLNGLLELLEDDYYYPNSSSSSSLSSSSSSDDEFGSVKRVQSRSNSGGFVRGTEPIVCHPGSSLVAVMIQALAHRLNYVWVIEQDYSLVGMVTFAGMLKAFRDRVPSFS